jgi:hypothetical protein
VAIDQGLVTYKLGTDTTVSQYFEINDRHFKTTILLLTGQVVKYEGLGELDNTGDLKKVESKSFTLDSLGNWKLVSEGVNLFNGDSSVYTSVRNGKVASRRAVVGKGVVSNAADVCSFYVFPYMGYFAPKHTGDTLFHCQLAFVECRSYMVSRVSKKELRVGSNVMGKLSLFVDAGNHLVGANAIGSSLNFVCTVEREKKDYSAYIDLLAKRRFASGIVAPRMVRDTAVFVSGSKKLDIDYWGPIRRNRVIFGEVVPWNRVWRTGANNATQLHTTSDVILGGNTLAAGKYTLWTYPTEAGWQLIVNKKADIWGTEYDPKTDLFKVPLQVEKTSSPVEIMKISLVPQDANKARIFIEWEYYRAWIDVVLK